MIYQTPPPRDSSPDDDSPNRAGGVLHPSLALAAYADELVAGARVAIFGDATLDLPYELLERGARLVHVYDFDPARLAEATAKGHEHALYFGALRDNADVGVRDGAFDLVLIPDLSFAPQVEPLLALARRVLSASGAAIVASPNIDAKAPPLMAGAAIGTTRLGYYELYEAIARHFPRVRMFGQVPFVGYTLAEFSAEGDPIPTVDGSLNADERDPEWFVALASARGLRLDRFAIVEMPWADLAPLAPGPGPSTPPDEPAVVEELRRSLEQARARTSEAEAATGDTTARARLLEQRVSALEQDLRLASAQVEQARERLSSEEARRAALETENLALRNDPEPAKLRDRVRALEGAVETSTRQHERALEAATQQHERALEAATRQHEHDLEAATRQHEHDLEAAARPHLEALEAATRQYERDVSDLEATLRARGTRLAELEAELARREQVVREMLVLGVSPTPTAEPSAPGTVEGSTESNGTHVEPPTAEGVQGQAAPTERGACEGDVANVRAELDRLANEVSRREADLIAAGWKIAQLERELSQVQR